MTSITAATTKKEGLPQSNIKFSGPWTEQEHEAFKQGVLGMGWSRWKKIQELYVPTRSKDQVSRMSLVISGRHEPHDPSWYHSV